MVVDDHSALDLRFKGEDADVRRVGQELGARYVLEGSLRASGATLRVSVQLIDAEQGAHLWSECGPFNVTVASGPHRSTVAYDLVGRSGVSARACGSRCCH